VPVYVSPLPYRGRDYRHHLPRLLSLSAPGERLVTRPALRAIPLSEGWLKTGEVTVTMSAGQWDAFLAASYEAGCVLLELDDDERPVRAYQKAEPVVSSAKGQA